MPEGRIGKIQEAYSLSPFSDPFFDQASSKLTTESYYDYCAAFVRSFVFTTRSDARLTCRHRSPSATALN